MQRTTVAIIGAGGIAKSAVVPALADLGFNLVGVSRRTPGKAAEFAAGVTNADGTPVLGFDNVRRMLEQTKPRIAIDCSGSGGHVQNGIDCCENGVAYLGEKPLVMNIAEWQALRDAAKKSGTKVGGILQHFYLPVYRAALNAIVSGRLGNILLWQVNLPWFRGKAYFDSADWRAKAASDGGVLMNQTLHEVGQLTLLASGAMRLAPGVNPVSRLTAICSNLAHTGTDERFGKIDVEDTAAVLLQMRDGSLATIGCTTGAGGARDGAKKFAVYGTRGKIEVSGNALTLWDLGEAAETDEMMREHGTPASGNAASNPLAIGHAGHRENIRAFAEWALGETDSYPLELAVAALPALTVDTMYQSSAQNSAWLTPPDTTEL